MRVFVLSAFPAVRAGLVAVVRGQPGWDVTGDAAPTATPPRTPSTEPTSGSGSESALELPDVLLVDLDGIESADTVAQWASALRPARGVLVLAPPGLQGARGRANPDALRTLEELARLANEQNLAFGALLRDATADEILAAAGAVGGGLIALDRRLATDMLAPPERTPVAEAERLVPTTEVLTARELEVLQLLAEGLPNKLIAHRLHISEHTAKFHVSAILTKLGASSRTEAVSSAARRGLLIL